MVPFLSLKRHDDAVFIVLDAEDPYFDREFPADQQGAIKAAQWMALNQVKEFQSSSDFNHYFSIFGLECDVLEVITSELEKLTPAQAVGDDTTQAEDNAMSEPHKISDGQWWGYEMVKGAIMAWGARAIFTPISNPKRPLDFLHDRQGHFTPDERYRDYQQFAGHINEDVMPRLQELSSYFDTMDRTKFVWHFPSPFDKDTVIVAQGSPNASGGYFYLSISLVPCHLAPEVMRPPGYKTEAEIAAMRKFNEAAIAANQARMRAYNKAETKIRKARTEKNLAKLTGPFKKPGEALMVGDTLEVYANQGQRRAHVKAVAGDEALIEYFMPNGRAFLRIISVLTQGEIRSVAGGKIPKRFQ